HTRNADALAFQARAEGKALGALAAEGSLAIGTQQRLRASGSVERFNLAALGDFPASELNARFETDGVVAPAPDAGFAITIGPSRLRGYPLSGNARGRLREKSIEDLELALAAGGNSLTATGRVNTQDNRFAWKIDAPNLAQLGRDFSGRVKGEGMLSGPTAALAIDVNLDARELRAPGGIALESMVLRGQARLAQDAPFRLSANVNRLRIGDSVQLTSMRVEGDGTSTRHTIALAVAGSDLDLNARFAGGYFAAAQRGPAEAQWRGRIEGFENRGRWPARLLAPAGLLLAASHLRLADANFDFNGGRIALAEFDRTDAGIVTRGEVTRLPTRPILDALKVQAVGSTLVVSGRWDLTMRDTL